MKVVHITPTYFDQSSIIGGGERYPTDLATWMAKETDTTLVSFSSQRKSYMIGKLKVEIYPVKHFIHGNRLNPLSISHLTSIFTADVVHVHHLYTLISDLSCMTAKLAGKPTFATDYGGGGSFVLNQKLPIFSWYRNIIAYSEFGVKQLPKELQPKSILIKGGIDTSKFYPDPSIQKQKKILFVGRILPHKGINYLVDAFRLLDRPDYQLMVIGKVYDERYYADLQKAATGLNIEFVHDADDRRLLSEYQTATVTVLPSVHKTCYGDYTPVPELMGITLMESQACGTPVICTDAGAMYEFVQNRQTGFVVEQNSAVAIADALDRILNQSTADYMQYQSKCREWITHCSWNSVIHKHLKIYQ